MQTALDCIPCIVRQALESARFVNPDARFQEKVLRHILAYLATMDMKLSPPGVGQIIHREIRRMTGIEDPYQEAKDRFNQMAMRMLPALKQRLSDSTDPFSLAVRMAIAGNVIDLGINASLTETDARHSLENALSQTVTGDMEAFRTAIQSAQNILFLADNAGEILFDRLLIEQLPMDRVTLAVRGMPVLNDATKTDAQFAGLDQLVRVIDNGSDAPGTILSDCSAGFLDCFNKSDMIIAKGQGNFETLSDEHAPVYFLFKAKCAVIATKIGVEQGALMLLNNEPRPDKKGNTL